MTESPPLADYPLAETRPERVRALSGKPMAAITLDAVLAGEVGMDDLRIDAGALRQQAAIARAAGRPTLARNLERGADLVAVPQDVIMRIYDLLRPGRARSKDELLRRRPRRCARTTAPPPSPPSSRRRPRSTSAAASSPSASEAP